MSDDDAYRTGTPYVGQPSDVELPRGGAWEHPGGGDDEGRNHRDADPRPLAAIYRDLQRHQRSLRRRIKAANRMLARASIPGQEQVLVDMEVALEETEDLLSRLEPYAHLAGHQLIDVDCRALDFHLESVATTSPGELSDRGGDWFAPVHRSAQAARGALERDLGLIRGGFDQDLGI